jgi:predicted enzyme related to lactoylglutathione lyase
MSGHLTHFEIYGEEPAALAEFYRELLGWQLERAEGVEYWRIPAVSVANGGMGGGLTSRPPIGPCGWMHYVNVECLDDCVTEAERLGGRVLRPKTAVPKTAWYAVLADPEGNAFAVWQPDPAAFPLPEPD